MTSKKQTAWGELHQKISQAFVESKVCGVEEEIGLLAYVTHDLLSAEVMDAEYPMSLKHAEAILELFKQHVLDMLAQDLKQQKK
jgi:hypothetical protein